MNRKWLEQEGPNWVNQQIITSEQFEEIINLYPPHQRRMQLLPVLASILIGLSLLTFVASNWAGLSHLVRLMILIVTMTGFYSFGFSFYNKGHQWVGQGLLGLGVITFGGSMILIGQMYHLIAYDARLFVLWSLAAVGLLYLLRRSFFFYLASALIFAGQVYAMTSFGQMSYLLFAITIVGLGYYAFKGKKVSFGFILVNLLGLQMLFLLIEQQLPWAWVSLIPFILYAFGLWLGERPVAHGFHVGPIVFGFGFAVFMVFLHDFSYEYEEFFPNPITFAIVYFLLLLLAGWKIKRDVWKWTPILLFLPLFYLSFGGFIYLISMFVYASFLIYIGDEERHAWKANLGVIMFLISSVVGYFQLAWAFLDKSIFFLFGGALLFMIHWILRRRNRWLVRGGE
ncbi:hypothetical protein BEP19_04350 [Ammoniphilus oxalaticus]|uniref:DUF2157 domain-containing protein n=1 Tax=Ammoniphilus oxalaticus TaxID=66863 RepID=A0A419SLW9_9BACL|nr:DUF2157 domain-containing protein [Ammoniphilus oxalaticus]RKD25059.1 hypothetical protein BEP19_04350 [Ammoniphilus oxalaticus]